jgi:hypothetical protein
MESQEEGKTGVSQFELVRQLILQNRARTGVRGGAAPLGWWMRRIPKASSVLSSLFIPTLVSKVDSSIRRYRARFCKRSVNSKPFLRLRNEIVDQPVDYL